MNYIIERRKTLKSLSAFFIFFYTPSYDMFSSLVASSIINFFFAKLMLFPVARTDENLKIYTCAFVIIFIFSILEFITKSNLYNLLLTSLLTGAWFTYVFWYSKLEQREKSTILELNKQIPNFPLENTSGKKLEIYNYIGNPMIILFYRGNWCPLCMAQIKEIASKYQELESMGVKTILVSNQPHQNSQSLSDKFKVNFDFLVDKNNEAAQELGIDHKYGIPGGFQVFGYDSDTAMPTLIITDETGKVIFLDQTDNYRVRPEPDTFIRILKEKGINR